MAGYFTDKNKKLYRFAGGDNSTKYCLPVGTIFPSAIPLTDASVHLLDGSTIPQTGVYQEFAELVKSLVSAGYNISCSQSDFDSAVSSTGNCGKFVIDNTSNTIRLPKITRFIQGLSNMIDIGKSIEAGLPNITGEESSGRGSNFTGISGAFSEKLNTSGKELMLYYNASNSTSNYHQTFDASRSNSIYGKSTTVQPQATSFPYYIVLANGFVSDVKLNVDNFINDLNNKLSKTDIVRYVTETYISSDGNTWFIKYNDGWKECGGYIVDNNSIGNSGERSQTITLPDNFAFSNTNYQILVANTWVSSGGVGIITTSTNNTSKTTTQFSISYRNVSGGTVAKTARYWEAKGY